MFALENNSQIQEQKNLKAQILNHLIYYNTLALKSKVIIVKSYLLNKRSDTELSKNESSYPNLKHRLKLIYA